MPNGVISPKVAFFAEQFVCLCRPHCQAKKDHGTGRRAPFATDRPGVPQECPSTANPAASSEDGRRHHRPPVRTVRCVLHIDLIPAVYKNSTQYQVRGCQVSTSRQPRISIHLRAGLRNSRAMFLRSRRRCADKTPSISPLIASKSAFRSPSFPSPCISVNNQHKQWRRNGHQMGYFVFFFLANKWHSLFYFSQIGMHVA